MTEDEFRTKNARRRVLLNKQFSGFTEEENCRPYDQFPGWKEEVERRCQANLTSTEREELQQLQKEVEAYMSEKYPMPDLKEIFGTQIEEVLGRISNLREKLEKKLKSKPEHS